MYWLSVGHVASASLLLKGPHVGDKGFGVFVRNSLCRFHHDLAFLILEAFLDGLQRGIVLQLCLDFGIRVILAAGLLSHLSLAFAVSSVALLTILFIQGFSILRL